MSLYLRERLPGILTLLFLAGQSGPCHAAVPGAPLVFIPGIAGSVLSEGTEVRWPTVSASNIRALNLGTGAPNIRATDVLRVFDDPSVPFGLARMDIYQPFLTYLTSIGHVEFDLGGDPERLTSDHLITAGLDPLPTLFPFPYDWRQKNASHTATLDRYLQNIRHVHDGTKVTIVAHSMGGLLARRYLLEYGSTHVERVITIGSPFWGAPVSTYRMMVGDLFGISLIDWWDNGDVSAALRTFPAFHELLPSDLYFRRTTTPVFEEDRWDFNQNGIASEIYTRDEYFLMMDHEASPDVPSSNNQAFHSYQEGRQDDWSTDDSSVAYYHFIGAQDVDDTTVKVIARAEANWGGETLFGNRYVWVEEKGPGDGTVPVLSAARTPVELAPDTVTTWITGGDDASHNGLMTNAVLWNLMTSYFTNGLAAALLTSPESSSRLATHEVPTHGTIQIQVSGLEYVHVTDEEGRTNDRLGDVAIRALPGVDIRYDRPQRVVQIKTADNRSLRIQGDPAPEAHVSIQIVELDPDGRATRHHRHRLMPGAAGWQLQLIPEAEPVLHLDEDLDREYEPHEHKAPSHAAAGETVDVHAPTIMLEWMVNGSQVVARLLAEDSVDSSPQVRYSVNFGPLEVYTAPLEFNAGQEVHLRAFAEDSLGNSSGVIEVDLNPGLETARSETGAVRFNWPITPGFILEETDELGGAWVVSTNILRSEEFLGVEITTPSASPRKFYRLKSVPVRR